MRGDNYVIKDVNNLSGLDKLRIRAAGHERRGEMDAANALYDIADQIAREHAEDCYKMGLNHGTVSRVIADMERHVLGHEGMEDSPVARWARELREALGGNGRDHAADISVSAYDLLPQEDREAIAWVRDHGGLDYVKSEWRSRVPYDRYERRRQRLLGHIAECETALGRRREIISELNHRASDLTRENAELRKRAMPEGYEWPRFEDGEPVRIGDVAVLANNEPHEVESMEFFADKSCKLKGKGTPWMNTIFKGQVAKRPAPKVYDADGAEIRVGDTVWPKYPSANRDAQVKRAEVVGIQAKYGRVDVRTVYATGLSFLEQVDADRLTHRAPALAADGKPLREGETVWNVKTGERYVVGAFASGCVNVSDGRGGGLQLLPSQLTHERPESWERLEEDANAAVCVYFGTSVKDCENCDHNSWECSYDKARDLVRRAKELAGVSE